MLRGAPPRPASLHHLQPASPIPTRHAMSSSQQIDTVPTQSLINVAHVIYALHAVSLVVGAFGAATVIGMFLFGWPSIIAVIIAYVKRSDARGTWLESHFRWQIRTFWYALLWAIIVAAVSLVLVVVIIGFATWVVGLFLLGIWAIYRIARGWMRLADRQPMPG
jgi:uncharacterized membrane protein